MRVFKRIILFALINLLVLGMIQFALAPVSTYEQEIRDFYAGDYDSVVLGSSYGANIHAEYLPDGEKTCNLSRADIPLIDFYYIVRELDKHQDLKRVYIDICVPYWTGELGDVNRVDMMQILSGFDRLSYLFRVLGAENYNDFFFRYEVNSNTVRSIPETISKKLHALFPQPEQTGDADHPGPLFAFDPIQDFKTESFAPEKISQKSIDAFDALARYCEAEEIQLICFMTAFPRERLEAENMGDAHDYFTDLLSKYDLPLYDMNYVKWSIFPRTIEEYYDMDGHMLAPLGQRQTALLGEIMASDHPEDYFETSYEAVLAGIEAATA